MIPFSLVWCGFAVFWTFGANGMGAPLSISFNAPATLSAHSAIAPESDLGALADIPIADAGSDK